MASRPARLRTRWERRRPPRWWDALTIRRDERRPRWRRHRGVSRALAALAGLAGAVGLAVQLVGAFG